LPVKIRVELMGYELAASGLHGDQAAAGLFFNT
jgi:hypothetical protein